MCGIVGYVGPRDCSDVLVSALQKLEYRGYDSAGIAVFENGKIVSVINDLNNYSSKNLKKLLERFEL